MELRKNKDVENILNYTKELWYLTINEEDVLETVLHSFLAGDEKILKQIGYLCDGDIEDLLETLKKGDIQEYAEEELGMVSEEDEDDLVEALRYLNFDFIKEVSDSNMIKSLEADGWIISDGDYEMKYHYDLVDNNLITDIEEVFNNLNTSDRQRLRDYVLKFK